MTEVNKDELAKVTELYEIYKRFLKEKGFDQNKAAQWVLQSYSQRDNFDRRIALGFLKLIG